jgi:hypothetical protein
LALLLDVPAHLVQPVLVDLLQRQLVSHVRHQNYGVCVLVVALHHRTEPLLPGSVPQLQLHEVPLDVERPAS